MVEETQSNHRLENQKNLHPKTNDESEIDRCYQKDGRDTEQVITEQVIAQEANATN